MIAANSDGVWNTRGQSLRLAVLPPFYRTWWFITLAALGVGGAGLALLAVPRRATGAGAGHAAGLRARADRLAGGERKRIAAELHDGLGQAW